MVVRKSTKDILAESLKELGSKTSIDKITIQDICDNCSVGRTTFYYHFHDKYELVAWIYEQSIGSIMSAFSSDESVIKSLVDYIKDFIQYADYYISALRNTKDDVFFIKTMYQITTKLIDERLQRRDTDIDRQLRFAINFDVRLAVWSVIDWYVSGRPCLMEELAKLIYESFSQDVKNFLLVIPNDSKQV